MDARHRLLLLAALLLLVATPALVACGATPAPTAAPTSLPPTATPKGPAVGGKLTIALKVEPPTLDIHKSTNDAGPLTYLNGTLVLLDPDTGKYIPYLAESWKVSDDGLNVDFKLKKGIKFHDGTPMTAADFAWTFARAVDPETKSPTTGPMLSSMSKAEALDDQTLRLTLKAPSFPFLFGLTVAFTGPLSKASVDKLGPSFERQPIGVGPYKMKEWKVGDRIVLERNPDYAWGPAYGHQGPYYVETLEYRIIPEDATILAGLESGEIDYTLESLRNADLKRLADTGKLTTYQGMQQGVNPHIMFNVQKEPFTDVRVRQAFNMAIDRQSLVTVVEEGFGVPQYGPLSASVAGYSPVPDQEMKYAFDLSKAKALMLDAGFTARSDGMLEKAGQPLSMKLVSYTYIPQKTLEVIQEQLKKLGVDLQIERGEPGVVVPEVIKGNYQIGVFMWLYGEFDIMWLAYHSTQIGSLNRGHLSDPELDRLLDLSRTTMDPTKRQQVADQIQKYFVDQAYIVPLETPIALQVLSKRVQGARFRTIGNPWDALVLNDAYIVQ